MFCPQCATENDSQQGYCRKCGLPLAGARLALERHLDQTLAEFEGSRVSFRRARTFMIGALIWAVFSALFFLTGAAFTRELLPLVIGVYMFLSLASVFEVKGLKRFNRAYRQLTGNAGSTGPVLGKSGRDTAALPEGSTADEIVAPVRIPISVVEQTTLDLKRHQPKG
ncbi:MAG TPA: zinc ribbon domain-containing protein [Pyrinomonadaceae bacterium]